MLTFLVPLRLYWSQHAVSCEIPLADVTWYANEEDATIPTVSNAVTDRFMDVTFRRARKHQKASHLSGRRSSSGHNSDLSRTQRS